jgi:hypothetical protein
MIEEAGGQIHVDVRIPTRLNGMRALARQLSQCLRRDYQISHVKVLLGKYAPTSTILSSLNLHEILTLIGLVDFFLQYCRGGRLLPSPACLY